MSAGRRMLVIGASGFIGANVCETGRAEGYEVIGASRHDPQHAVDLLDASSIRNLVASTTPDVIVNAAGPPSVARSWELPAETAEVHAIGALRLLEAARTEAPSAHLICLSSAEVYGSGENDFSEADPVRPITPYGAAKAAMEIFSDQHARAHGLQVSVVRPFNQIGPGLAPGHAIADFVGAVAAAEREGFASVELRVGNPDSVRDYTDVRDAVRAILDLAGQGTAGTFNLCSGTGVSISELIGALDEATSLEVRFRVDESLVRPADPARKVGRADRLADATGWRAGVGLKQSLRDMLAGARTAGCAD